MPSIYVDHRSIAYEARPDSIDVDKLTVIFVHGTGGDRRDWRFQLEGLGSSWQTIALELPGHGQSVKPGESDVSRYASCVEGFVEKLGLNNVVVVGCSLGSAIAQTIALNPKPWLKAVCLVGAGARLRVMPELLEALLNSSQAALENLAVYCLSDSAPDNLRQEMNQKYVNSDPLLIHSDLSACDKFDVLDVVGSIKLPTLIIVGAQDRLTPVKYSKFLNQAISGSELTVIDKGGHLVMLEQPDAFNSALGSFLGRVSL